MKTYTIYNTDTNLAEAQGKPHPCLDGVSDPVGMPSNLILLEEIRTDKPQYDYLTQKVEAADVSYDLINKTATFGWDVIALTQDEIDSITPPYFEYNNNGIKLGVQDYDQSAFGNLLLLVNESNMADTEMLQIQDIYKNSFGVTVAQFKEMIVPYGLHCYTLFNS